jgi:23S rRNA pseudouridine1911/1915/1917 synthase
MKITITADLPTDETSADAPAPRNGNVIQGNLKRTSRDRADRFLHELFSEHDELLHLSRSQIQKLIEQDQILVNSKPIKANTFIPFGASIEVTIHAPVELEAVPQNIPLQILFEDEHIVVINKQPRLTMHPSETQRDGTLVNALLYHVKDLSGIGGVLRPGIVHRIDKDTSGVIVVTKSDVAHAGLSKLLENPAGTSRFV